jgi:hypothetical protein
MAIACPPVISCNVAIQLNKHVSTSAGLMSRQIAWHRSCDGIPAFRSRNFSRNLFFARPNSGVATTSSAPRMTAHPHEVDSGMRIPTAPGAGHVGSMLFQRRRFPDWHDTFHFGWGYTKISHHCFLGTRRLVVRSRYRRRKRKRDMLTAELAREDRCRIKRLGTPTFGIRADSNGDALSMPTQVAAG